MSARSSSRPSSSRSSRRTPVDSSRDAAAANSPQRQSEAATAAAAAPPAALAASSSATISGVEQVHRAIIAGDSEAFESAIWRIKNDHSLAVDTCSKRAAADGLSGDAVFLSAVLGRWDMFFKLVVVLGDDALRFAYTAATQLLALRRVSALKELLRRYPQVALETATQSGESLLHHAMRCSNPHVEIVKAIAAASKKRAVNLIDFEDRTPLHVLATHATSSVAAKHCVTILLKNGADLFATDRAGKTAMALCTHGNVRDVLSQFVKQSHDMRQSHVTDEFRRSVAEYSDVTKLPPMSPSPSMLSASRPESRVHANSDDNDGEEGTAGRRTPHVTLPEDEHRVKYGAQTVSSEELSTIVNRLYELQPTAQKRRHERAVAEALNRTAPERKSLDADTIQASVDRLYVTPAAMNEKRDALRGKYIRERTTEETEKMQRTREELIEASTRMCHGAMQKRLEVSEKLSQTLLADPCPHRQLEKGEQLALATRLHDTQREKTRRVNESLYEKYLKEPDGRFAGRTRLPSPEKQKEMADRLSKSKGK